jgi:hypothetical protein
MSDVQPDVLSFLKHVLLLRHACADHYHRITIDYLSNWTSCNVRQIILCELKLSDVSYRGASRTEFW